MKNIWERYKILAVVVVIIFAGAGTFLFLRSKAATPGYSLNSDKGSLANCASVQSNSSASDGKYVLVNSSSCQSGGGGGGGSLGGGTKMTVGVDTGEWGSVFSQLHASGINYYRMTSGAAARNVGTVPASGGQIASVIFGTGGTIGSINPTSYAQSILSYFQQHGKAGGLAFEVLNEPGGYWFWSDSTNYSAYTSLAKAAHEAIATLPAATRPVELCSWDGGQVNNNSFGRNTKADGVLQYCDGVTVHPYGGSGGQYGGAQGDHAIAQDANSETGLPVYVTEVGWPTATGQSSTGDSQQWTQAQQASNITNFVAWARSTGYINMVINFNYQDYGTNPWYGITSNNGAHKLSWNALAAASHP